MSERSNGDHPPEELLIAWRDTPADLPAAAVERLRRHLPGCAECTRRVAGLARVEQGLETWGRVSPAVPAGFAARVLAALPAQRYPAVPLSLGAWARQQAVAVALMLAGLIELLLSGDALALVAQWWQTAGTALSTASIGDSESLSTWLAGWPSGSLESHLDLLPGALLLGLGAGMVLIRNLRLEGSGLGDNHELGAAAGALKRA